MEQRSYLKYAGVIIATTTAKNNSDTATPFTLPKGAKVAVQPDVACYLRMDGTTATAATGVLVEANALFEVRLAPGSKTLSAIVSAGTVNAKVFVARTV